MKKDLPLILPPAEAGTYGAAREAFETGGIIAYPTETFYGLGVDPFNELAVARLFSLKGRPADNPVSLLIKDVAMLMGLIADAVVPPLARPLIERHWPGPLTIVFRAAACVPDAITAGTGKVGVRVSSSLVARRLVRALGSPVTATSANPSTEPPARSAQEVLAYFNGGVDVVIDVEEGGGKLTEETGSTVVDATGKRLIVLREGCIPSSALL